MASNETVANNAKIHEALETLVDIVDAWKDHLPPVIREGELAKAIKKAEAALAAPRLNCEVGTAEEQFLRHDKYCNNQPDCKLCNSPAAANNCIRCYAAWAQTPYPEGDMK